MEQKTKSKLPQGSYSQEVIDEWETYLDRIFKTNYKPLEEYPSEDQKKIAKEIADKITYRSDWEELKKKKIMAAEEEKNHYQYRLQDLSAEVARLIAMKQRNDATEEIVNYLLEEHNIYSTRDDVKSEMWIYSEGIYISQGKSFIKEICRKVLGQLYTTQLLNEVLVKVEADTFIEQDEFFNETPKELIAVKNGLLNIFTRDLEDFSPEKIFFNKLPVKYVSDAKCEKIDKFISEVLKDKSDINVFYELAGFGLLKDYKLEKAVMLVGEGRNGKGKTIELLKRLVGAENCSGVPLTSLHAESFSVGELFGKFFNLAGDISSTDLRDTGMLKALTGRDLISAKRKFLNNLVFTNHTKLIFACNELPKVYDTSVGFWERWVLLEFPYRFVDRDVYNGTPVDERKNWKIKDVDIIEKITTDSELSGFLNKALEGLQTILKTGKFSYSVGTDEIKNTWVRKADSFMAFCWDHIEEKYDGKISKNDLRKRFSKYCKNHRVRGAGDKSIKITLQELYGVGDDYSSTSGFGNIQEHNWVGIKWKTKEKC